MSMNLDKSAWKRVALGDVADASKAKVDPSDGTVTRYVAGEHMDTDDLKIHRWGEIGDDYLGPAFHRRFRPGQVLYGSRRTYLRKVAVADFDGVCANTTFVIQSRDDRTLLPDFLPWIMTSETFHTFAIAESKGSVNPYVNWSDIARFEFGLPSIGEQVRLSELLWAADRERSSSRVLMERVGACATAMTNDVLNETDASSRVPLEDLVADGSPITYGIVQAGPDIEDGVPYIRVSDMSDGHLTLRGMKRTSEDIARRYQRSRVEVDDLVVALRGRTGLTLSVPTELSGANLTQGTARVAIDPEKVNPEYVRAVMNSAWMATHIQRVAKGSTFTELSLAALRGLPIPRLGRQAEEAFLVRLAEVRDTESQARRRLHHADALRASVLTEVSA